jgi:hypothetical protein
MKKTFYQHNFMDFMKLCLHLEIASSFLLAMTMAKGHSHAERGNESPSI